MGWREERGEEVVGGWDSGDRGGSRWWEQVELAELLGFSCHLWLLWAAWTQLSPSGPSDGGGRLG